MKKILIILTLCFFGLVGYSQNIKSKVDKRVELLSIIFRLAGNKEYNDNFAKTYVADINKHFSKFKNDSLIQFARQLHENDGISYDAVMTFAVCLIYQNNHFVLEKNFKSDLDKRWKEKDALKFLSLLNTFYVKSSFTEFFNGENKYYSLITTSLDTTLKTFNTSWFYKYFGKSPEEQFNLVVGCGNGGGNYGVKNHDKEIFAIIGSYTFNDLGFPVFKAQDCFPTIVHEFNHSFINPLLNNYEANDTLRKSTTILLDSMKSEMENQAYSDWQTLVNESLVRASVVRYLIDNGAEEKVVNAEIADQTGRGFIWMEDLVELLEKYENDRNDFPTFNSFYSKIIAFFHKASLNISSLKRQYEDEIPKVVSIDEFKNGTSAIDSHLKGLTINFNMPMTGEAFSSIRYREVGRNFIILNKSDGEYLRDNKSYRIKINLKPTTKYELIMIGFTLKSEKGFGLKKYKVYFTTK